jgi:hypothetical protein
MYNTARRYGLSRFYTYFTDNIISWSQIAVRIEIHKSISLKLGKNIAKEFKDITEHLGEIH